MDGAISREVGVEGEDAGEEGVPAGAPELVERDGAVGALHEPGPGAGVEGAWSETSGEEEAEEVGEEVDHGAEGDEAELKRGVDGEAE